MKYEGQLTIHHEIFVGMWPQFHDDRGLKDGGQWDWDWTINFNKETNITNIKVWDKDDVLLYDDKLTFDPRQNYDECVIEGKSGVFGFLLTPLELTRKQWMELCTHGNKCEIETDYVVTALSGVEE